MISRRVWLCSALAAAALTAAILFTESASPGQAQHQAFIQLLDDMRALDDDLTRHALEARFQLVASYDQLTKDDLDVRATHERIAADVPEFLREGERASLQQALARYTALASERQRLLEDFKSKNALLKNSVSYFPSLAVSALSQTHDPELTAHINELRALTLNLALRGGPQMLAAQNDELAFLAGHSSLRDSGVSARSVELMLAHARTIADSKAKTDGVLTRILELPLGAARDEAARRYAKAYVRADTEAHWCGLFVAAMAFALLGLATHIGLRLRRAAVELGMSNERLELAVVERTNDLRGEMDRRQRVELELRQAQKLEAVGQLAAGIAHEINTPIQYVGDSVYFLREAFGDVLRVLDGYRDGRDGSSGSDLQQSRLAAQKLEEELDFPGLRTEIPEAFERTLAGAREVSDLVKAMKTFAHTAVEKVPVDLNGAIENTLIVARNEYKYVADLVTELGELPQVTCNAGGIRQVLLNLIVNAAHAISDVVADSDRRGTITIRSYRRGESVVIGVADTGAGIPEIVREKVYDPFFTTKAPGKGSGQGLAISRNIVEQHQGKLWFETELDRGTTFYVELPIASNARGDVADAIRAA